MDHENETLLEQIENILGNRSKIIDDSAFRKSKDTSDGSFKYQSDDDNRMVWFAAYDHLICQNTLNHALKDTFEEIKNSMMIELEGVHCFFYKISNSKTLLFAKPQKDKIWMVRLFLIDKKQITKIMKSNNEKYGDFYEKDLNYKNINLKNNNLLTIINKKSPYGWILNLGSFKGYQMYTITNYEAFTSEGQFLWSPSVKYIKQFYETIKNNFCEYTSEYIVKYINSWMPDNNKLPQSFLDSLQNKSITKVKSRLLNSWSDKNLKSSSSKHQVKKIFDVDKENIEVNKCTPSRSRPFNTKVVKHKNDEWK